MSEDPPWRLSIVEFVSDIIQEPWRSLSQQLRLNLFFGESNLLVKSRFWYRKECTFIIWLRVKSRIIRIYNKNWVSIILNPTGSTPPDILSICQNKDLRCFDLDWRIQFWKRVQCVCWTRSFSQWTSRASCHFSCRLDEEVLSFSLTP